MKKKNNNKVNLVDLDDIEKMSCFEVSVNGKTLPLKIGDQIAFPANDPILKTITAIQVNENGQESYCLEWFDGDSFKQYWISLTELKILKDNVIKRKEVSFFLKESKV